MIRITIVCDVCTVEQPIANSQDWFDGCAKEIEDWDLRNSRGEDVCPVCVRAVAEAISKARTERRKKA